MNSFFKYSGHEYLLCKETFRLPTQYRSKKNIFYKGLRYKCEYRLLHFGSRFENCYEALIVWDKGLEFTFSTKDLNKEYVFKYFYTQAEHRKTIIDDLI